MFIVELLKQKRSWLTPFSCLQCLHQTNTTTHFPYRHKSAFYLFTFSQEDSEKTKKQLQPKL